MIYPWFWREKKLTKRLQKTKKYFFGCFEKVFYICTPKKHGHSLTHTVKSSSIRNEKIVTGKGYRVSKLAIYIVLVSSIAI